MIQARTRACLLSRRAPPSLAVAAILLAAACTAPEVGEPGAPAAGPGGGGSHGGSGAAEESIPIGEFSSMTGATAAFGTSCHDGITLAADEVNAAGGVLGRPVRIFLEDDQSKHEEVPAVITRLIDRHKVVALLGEIASSRSLAAAPLAQRARIPMISPSSTNPRVTEAGEFIFRMCYLDDFQGSAMARFARRTLGLSKGAVLRDIRSDYSMGLADFFSQEFRNLGGTVLADEKYSEGESDFRAQLTKIKSLAPEFIFVPGYYADAAKIARQARDLGITVPLLGGDGWESSKLFEIGGEAIEGCFYSNHYFQDDPRREIRDFVGSFASRFGYTPDSVAALSYDAMKLLADAMGRAGTTDGDAVRKALAATRGWRGVTGEMSLDANRNPVKPIVVLEVRGGRMILRETMNP